MLFFISTKNRDQVQHQIMYAIHGLPATLCMLRVKPDKSDWFWSQSIVFTKPFKTGMSLDLAIEATVLDVGRKEGCSLWGGEWPSHKLSL